MEQKIFHFANKRIPVEDIEIDKIYKCYNENGHIFVYSDEPFIYNKPIKFYASYNGELGVYELVNRYIHKEAYVIEVRRCAA